MSRVIVKGLPKKITEKKLRDLFEIHGIITDIQLKYKSEGVFRQFGFIGFQDENVADKVIDHFNNTRIQTSKITVEKCEDLGSKKKKGKDKNINFNETDVDDDNLKINKKETKKKRKNDAAKELLEKYKDDPMFSEFLEVHSAKDAQELLKETELKEASDHEDNLEIDNKHDGDDGEKLANTKISDNDYMKTLVKEKKEKTKKQPKNLKLFTIKIQNAPYNCTKKDIKVFFKPLVPFTIRIPRKIKAVVYVGFKKEKDFKTALMKDKSILIDRQVLLKKVMKDDEKEVENNNSPNNKWKSQEESLLNEEGIAESGRIFFRNLSYNTVEDDLQKLFEKYGPVTEINIPIDKNTRKPKGYGIVTFLMPEHAVKAYTELDGSILHGRMLHLLPGKPKDNNDDDNDDSSNFKQKKTKQQKALAGSSHNWNSLFLGHDAVAEVIADTYNTTKEAVLDPHGKGSAAVRLALGETQIIANTRKYLEEHGVYLNAFNQALGKKSNVLLLVKNLPAGTGGKELWDLFEPHGILSRIIFPPKCLTAIIEFNEPSEAKKAFRRLAYTKFKSLPLYLEWAPENTLNSNKPESTNETKKNEEENIVSNEPLNGGKEQIDEKEVNLEEEEEPEDDTTLFVKNLNFRTTDNALRKHFMECGKICYASVATKKDPNNSDSRLSMGYGFVRFIKKSGADNAIKKLQQSLLDDKSIEIKRSERTLQNEVKSTRKTQQLTKQNGTKILIRNIPFQANYNEVKELFITFGEIKALRLPKKMGAGINSHRGFGFVDYSTNSDAKKAFEALSQSTHLYGRRLVLEWAATEEGVEMLRKRTADHFHVTEEVISKKSVFDMENKS